MNYKHVHQLAWLIFGLVILVNAGVVLGQVSINYDLHWNILSSGGGARSSVNFNMKDSLGLWSFGSSTSGNYKIAPGFMAGIENNLPKLYLPIITR